MKNTYVLLFTISLAVCLSMPAFSATTEQFGRIWTLQPGSNTTDEGRDVTVDSNGMVYVTGRTNGSIDSNPNNGLTDIFIIKYDFSSTKWWSRQIGTAEDDVAHAAAVDSARYLYVTGYTNGHLDLQINNGRKDAFLTRYNSSGTRMWTKLIGTPQDETAYAVAVDTSDYIYVTGTTRGDLGENQNAGGADVFLVKYSSAGTLIWTKTIGTSADEDSYGITIDTFGYIYIAGHSFGNFDSKTNMGYSDIFLAKYSPAGALVWTDFFGTDDYDECYGVTSDGYGDIYISGNTLGDLDSNNNAGSSDIFLAKYTIDGSRLWTKQLGTQLFDRSNDISADKYGHVYVTGYTNGGLDGKTNIGGADIFLVKFTSDGVKQWTEQYGTGDYDDGTAVFADNYNNIYITGITYGNLGENVNAGGCDPFLTKYGISLLPDYAYIKGHVYDTNDLPIINVKLSLYGDIYRNIYTDANGYYEFRNLNRSANSTLTVSKPGWEFDQNDLHFDWLEEDIDNLDFVGAFTGEAIDEITLPIGQGEENVTIELPDKGEIKVVMPDSAKSRRGTVNPNENDEVTVLFNSREELATFMGSVITMRVFNLMGELVYSEDKTVLNPDETWMSWIPEDIASGVYIVHIQGPGINMHKKIPIIR